MRPKSPAPPAFSHSRSDPRICALTPALATTTPAGSTHAAASCSPTAPLGCGDRPLDAGLGDDATGWISPRSRLVFSSRAAGLQAPIDGPEMRLDDVDAVRCSATRARALGFAAKLCLHPRQIATVNEAFGYDDRERHWAQRVVAAAANRAGAAVRVDGEMVDRPRLELARHILAGTAN